MKKKKTVLIGVIGIVQSYLAKWGEILNFGNTVTKIVRKSMREKKDEWCDERERKLNFGNEIIEILVLPSSCAWSEVPKMHARGSTWKGKQLWQPSCRNCKEWMEETLQVHN